VDLFILFLQRCRADGASVAGTILDLATFSISDATAFRVAEFFIR